MKGLLQFVKFLLWDWWHGTETGLYETTRGYDFEAPAFSIGSIDVPRWLVYTAILVVLLTLLIVGFANFPGIEFASQDTLPQHDAITKAGSCYAFDASAKRLYVAIDCLGKASKPLGFTAAAVILFLAGYFTRYLQEKSL